MRVHTREPVSLELEIVQVREPPEVDRARQLQCSAKSRNDDVMHDVGVGVRMYVPTDLITVHVYRDECRRKIRESRFRYSARQLVPREVDRFAEE